MIPWLVTTLQILSCSSASEMSATLLRLYGETPIAYRVVEPRLAQIFYASPSGTWTVVLTRVDSRIVCINQSGQSEKIAAEFAARGDELSITCPDGGSMTYRSGQVPLAQ